MGNEVPSARALHSHSALTALTDAGRRLSETSLQLLLEGGFDAHEAQLASTVFQAFLLGRLGIESAVSARRPGRRSGRGSAGSHLSADEAFDYGIAQLVSWLRMAAKAAK